MTPGESEFAEAMRLELVRSTLERFDRAAWSADAEVTEEEARVAIAWMDAERAAG
jgi:hypothetical protein